MFLSQCREGMCTPWMEKGGLTKPRDFAKLSAGRSAAGVVGVSR